MLEKSVTPSVPSAERALAILELLAGTRNGLTLPELSRRLGLPKSSTHCLLVTLERRGYLLRNEETHRYLFGSKLFSLANMALHGIKLREQARPFMQALVEQCQMTVHLAIRERDQAVVIEKVEPAGAQRITTWLGKRFDLHASGVGKALLAYLPEDELAGMVLDRGLTRYNENTITSLRRLKQEIAKIRYQGYALDDEEGEIGYRCIGCHIVDQAGQPVAAISVAGTISQITPENLGAVSALVKSTAQAISRSLGFMEVAASGIADLIQMRRQTG